MKITGGRARGMVLAPLKGLDIRPTSSKVREAIFNILGQDMSGVRVLDLFAGTGILGIEALSRGADSAIFIDKANKSIALINSNLASCGFQGISRVLKIDVIEGLTLESIAPMGEIDLVFIDPPYRKDIVPGIIRKISISGILSGQALVIAEVSKYDHVPEHTDKLSLTDTRIYGDTKIIIYKKESH